MPGAGSLITLFGEGCFFFMAFDVGAPGVRSKLQGLKGWSWRSELIIVSQITASERGIPCDELVEGQLAVT